MYLISFPIYCWGTETHLTLYITQVSSNPRTDIILIIYLNVFFGFFLYVTIASVNNSSVLIHILCYL